MGPTLFGAKSFVDFNDRKSRYSSFFFCERGWNGSDYRFLNKLKKKTCFLKNFRTEKRQEKKEESKTFFSFAFQQFQEGSL